jgi:hypothetical protein
MALSFFFFLVLLDSLVKKFFPLALIILLLFFANVVSKRAKHLRIDFLLGVLLNECRLVSMVW